MRQTVNLDFLRQESVTAARQLIGWHLYVVENDGLRTGGEIVETEAYSQEDAASHSYNGRTPRNDVMFGPAGRVYVYFTYGMHWCMNIVTGPDGHGEAVLIRALKPTSNEGIMRQRRNNRPDSELTDGPAKLCQALGVTGLDNGAVIGEGRFELVSHPTGTKPSIQATERIGIKQDTHRLWRFVAITDTK
jgi:DNA-3-methyladenine glycosylase